MEFLEIAAISIAVIHSLAPDHYVPFVANREGEKVER